MPSVANTDDGGAKPRGCDETAEPPATPVPRGQSDSASVVNKLREEGNARMRAGDPARAVELYSEALRPASTGEFALGRLSSAAGCLSCVAERMLTSLRSGVNRSMSAALAATLYSNRAAAHVALSNWEAAVCDAQAAVILQPGHVKAAHRLATALSALGRFREAVKACRDGAAALAAAGDRSAVFQHLIEQVRAVQASPLCQASYDNTTLPLSDLHSCGAEWQRCGF